MNRRRLLLGCLCAAYGCNEQIGGLLQGHEPAEVIEVSGDVVSRVNGSGIGAQEVARLAEVGKLTAEAALDRLQDERVLGQEAERRGYGASPRTREVVRKAQVQALLKSAVEDVAVSQDSLEAEYRAQAARFHTPERRAAMHVLARLPPDADKRAERAAETFIAQTIRALKAPAQRAEVLEAARSETSDLFQVVVEDLPPAAYDAYVPEFSSALFSLVAPGVVEDPVHTSFGIHAIVVTDIIPAKSQPRSVAFETLREEVTARQEKERFGALLADLRSRARVQLSPDAQNVLATLDF